MRSITIAAQMIGATTDITESMGDMAMR